MVDFEQKEPIEAQENIILIDWVSMTFKYYSVADVKRILGMDQEIPWQVTKGAHGYSQREYFEGISIHFAPAECQEYKVWLEMSGQGCRTYETYGEGCFQRLLSISNEDGVHVTRLDAAFDDHTGLIDIIEVIRKVYRQEYTALAPYWDIHVSSEGFSAYIGSPRSDIRIRIYDKAAERGRPEEHWNRVEIQMRNDHAKGFIEKMTTLGETFRGTLKKYLVFREPNVNDSHKYRWPVSSWYDELLDGVEKITLLSTPGVEYNMLTCENFVFETCGNPIDAWIKCYGIENFMRRLDQRKSKPKAKYDRLVEEHLGMAPGSLNEQRLTPLTKEQRIETVRHLLMYPNTPAIDKYGTHWVQCRNCKRIDGEHYFHTLFGKGAINQGICYDCDPITATPGFRSSFTKQKR